MSALSEKMAVNESGASDKPVSTLWGCELNGKNRSCTFRVDDTKFEHQLALRTMCLGAAAAADEFNVVELVTEQGGESKAFPLATLRASVMLTVNLSGMELSPPVTFRLRSGSGPVHVCAEHVALEEFSGEEGEEEELGEEEEEDEEEEPSPKPEKKQAARSAGKVECLARFCN
uniref:Nucleophosmin/nucleoplasmin, 2b n=1 Tax=Scleropages formosus TaxID=113540 RepID=A0A8C9RPB4_SCLFO